jgi:hydroxymethylpyrimidine pyrophosphatase-like HAD family hydrolase
MKAGYTFFPCTGRSRSSVGLALPREFIELYGKTLEDVPGVYLQGLIVFGTDGSVVYEETLKNNVIESATTFCEENGLELIAYCGEKIYTKKNCPLTVGITDLHDLMPLEFPEGLPRLITSGIKTNKLIVLEEDEKLIKMRPALEERLGKTATLTKAVPGMLEILPAGMHHSPQPIDSTTSLPYLCVQ